VLRSIRLHRLVASLVVAFAFLVSSVEVLLPEIHDGDAAAMAASATASCIPDHDVSATVVSHVEGFGAQHHSDAPSVPLSHHGPHVDHCGHSHLVTAVTSCANALGAAHPATPVTTMLTLTSVDFPPHKRPPIA
jgi:hypothetical protein